MLRELLEVIAFLQKVSLNFVLFPLNKDMLKNRLKTQHTTTSLELQIKTPHYCNACFDVARTKTNFSGGIQN